MVTEPLVDAKDAAHQVELRTDIANALLAVEQRLTGMTLWLAEIIIGVGIC